MIAPYEDLLAMKNILIQDMSESSIIRKNIKYPKEDVVDSNPNI